MNHEKNIGVILLAAGKGTRMNSQTTNKVAFPLGGKPMILHTVNLLKNLHIEQIFVVVGFAKESVEKALSGLGVTFVQQKKQLGTADAVSCAVSVLPAAIYDVLILQGDDSAFYKKEVIEKLISVHKKTAAAVTFLTITVDNPQGLGRVIRGKNGDVVKIIEEKDATGNQKKINEINPACYIMKTSFLKKHLPMIEKSAITGEYYLTSLIDTALKNKEKIATLAGGRILWRGVNTKEELILARDLFAQKS